MPDYSKTHYTRYKGCSILNLSVFSLYWDNIDDRIVAYQREVMLHHGIPIQQHRINGLDHGAWMDWTIRRNSELVLFMDVDCIILNRNKAFKYIEMATNGSLVGNVQATNHMGHDIAQKLFAAPSFLCVHKEMWTKLGKPSFKPTPYGDVAQLVTDTWKYHNVPVEYLSVTNFEVPKWDLPSAPQSYGIGTTFGDCVYHLFESRESSHIDRFLSKCGEVLDA